MEGRKEEKAAMRNGARAQGLHLASQRSSEERHSPSHAWWAPCSYQGTPRKGLENVSNGIQKVISYTHPPQGILGSVTVSSFAKRVARGERISKLCIPMFPAQMQKIPNRKALGRPGPLFKQNKNISFPPLGPPITMV